MTDQQLADKLDVFTLRIQLFSRLMNYKFEQACKYLEGSGLEGEDRDLIEYLSNQYGNCGWIPGDVSILINAALRSIPKYEDYLKAVTDVQ